MNKTFNVTGPCHPKRHYMLPTQERVQGLLQLIDGEQYFVIHAARQSGKTTLLLELARQLNEMGHYYALYCSLESVENIAEAKEGIPAIIRILKTQVKFHKTLKKYPFAEQVDYADFNVVLREALTYFCETLDKPLVVFFDEIDCLSSGTLISFLRQLRDGYVNRDDIPFCHSIGLVGMRNIRDYKSDIREEGKTLGSASPFNIVSETLTLRNFTVEEVTLLYAQHTKQTGQVFSEAVIETIYQNTCGQPWLVNAIAKEIVVKMLKNDVSQTIVPKQIEQAIQTLIQRRDTHIDSLMKRLTEARVQRIIEPIILGDSQGYDYLDDDYQYVLDLGLLRQEGQEIVPSNPIYAEVIILALNSQSQMEMALQDFPPLAPAYLVDGQLSMKILLTDFQQFWRENCESWVARYQYKEAAPHLIMQAFLRRIINACGQVSREMAAGRGRLDLCVHYQDHRYPIELKLRYRDNTYQEGKQQLAKYMDKLACFEGWLIVFDRRKKITWDQKIFWQTEKEAGKTIHIVGC